MKTRTFFSILTAIVLVLLLTGGAGAYWLAAGNFTVRQGVTSSPEAGVFISRQSPLVVSLLANPDRLSALGLAMVPPGQRRQVQNQWQHIRQTMLENSQLDYKRDIRPWLGDELTFAVTNPDLDRDDRNGQQPGLLLAAAVNHPKRAEQTIQAYWQRQAAAGRDLVFEQYAGIPLVYAASEDDPQDSMNPPDAALATAMVGDRFVLFANQPKVLRDALNNLQVPELSLNESESYQQALQGLSASPHVGVMFVHLPQLASGLKSRTAPILSNLVSGSPAVDSLMMALQFDRQGLLGDALLLAAPGKQIKPSQPDLMAPVAALQYIPATSHIVAAGKDLSQLWTQIEAGLEGYDSLQAKLLQPLDRLQRQWQVNLSEDVLSWMKGEYALGMLPTWESSQPNWVVVTERLPETEAELAKLNTIAQQQDISSYSFNLDDQTVAAWTKLSLQSSPGKTHPLTVAATVEGVHTTVGNYEIFATSLDAMAEALEASQDSILTTAPFQTAIATFATPNDGYFYMDEQSLQDTLNRSFNGNSPILRNLKSLLKHAKSLTISSYGNETNAYHSKVLLELQED